MNYYGKKTAHILFAVAALFVFVCGCGTSDATKEAADVPVTETTPIPVITPAPVDDTENVTEPAELPEDEDKEEIPHSFFSEEISDELFERMQGKSFPDECTTPREDLRYLHLLYKDIDGNTHEGEMVCNASIADTLTDIFRELYEADYPIERMTLIDDYDGDDDASMADNNTSCFNFRVVKGTSKVSKHGYGLAVDINPRYNPYVHTMNGKTVIEPENGEEFADRTKDFDYKIDENDLAYKLFTEAGFEWGGAWKNSKDYQHFQMRATP